MSDRKKPTFGQRLRSLITGTQEEFAQQLGITQPQLARYLAGRIPDPAILVRIAEHTGCSIDWLLRGVEAPRRDDRVAESLATYIHHLTPKRDADREEFLNRLVQYLATADREDVDSVRRLADALIAGSADVRRHLIGQLELIERLDRLERQAGAADPDPHTGKGSASRRPRSA